MKELIEYIVKQIVNHPDEVSTQEQENENEVVLTLSVNPEDIGIVIGKSGQTIKALRKILTIRARNEDKRVYLNINEPDRVVEESSSENEESRDEVLETKGQETERQDEELSETESDKAEHEDIEQPEQEPRPEDDQPLADEESDSSKKS